MKQIFFIMNIFFVFFLFIAGMCNTVFAEDNIIRLGYSDAEAFPYQIQDDANPPGIAFEIISEAARVTGIKIVYVRLPNKRVQNSLRDSASIDGAFMFSYSKDRLANGVYPSIKGKPDSSRKIATLRYYIYRKKGSNLSWDGKNISGFDSSDAINRIGANSGYSVVNDLLKKGVKVDDGSKTTEQNFLKLQTGRIAGFAQQDLVADNYITSKGITDIEKLPKPFIQKDYYLMFSRQFYNKNKGTVEKLWNKIGEIRDRKTYEVINKYTR